ncbi:MAG: DUF4439 domain-containing protein [Kineosporiaceae bacterium]
MRAEPRRSWSRRAVLGAALAAAVAPAAGCAWSPVRLDTASAAPQPPPLSPQEAARSVVAGGARAAVRVLGTADPAVLPADTGGRLATWVEIHRSHLSSLADAPAVAFPAGSAAGPPGNLQAGDPVRSLARWLGALGVSAAGAAATAPAAAPLHVPIAAARLAQEAALLAAAGLPARPATWPEGSPAGVLQKVLAAEHAVVDGYTTAAAWDSRRREEFLAAAVRHEAARDLLAELVASAGETPVPAAPGYALPPEAAPGAGSVAQRALALAVTVETGLARAAAVAAADHLAARAEAGGSDDADDATADPGTRNLVAAVAVVAAEAERARQAWGAPAQPLPGT